MPVWLPYLRGERTPVHLADLRAELSGLHIGHGRAELRRAAYEASGFVRPPRLPTGHEDTAHPGADRGRGRCARPGWVQALADCTGLDVDVAAVPDASALGAAFLARCTAGLESQATAGRR